MFHYLKQTMKHSAVYSFANLLQKGVGFLMIPVYTRFLSPTDYGVLEMLDLTMMVISMISGMKIGSAIVRFYYRYDSLEDKREVLSTGLIGITFFALVMVALFELLAKPISGLVLGSAEYTHFFQIVFISIALQTVAVVPESLLLAKKKSITFSTITLLTFVSYLSLNIVFIVVMKMGVMGMVLSTFITKILNLSMLLVVTRGEYALRFSWVKFKSMVHYSLPLLPAGICMFAVHYSDRYFIQKFLTLEDLGIYSLGYKFGMIISMLVAQPIFRIWNAQRYEIAKLPDSDVVYGRMFTYILSAFLFVGLIISTLIDETVSIMAPESYQGASGVVALIVVGYILFGCASFNQLGMYVGYKTKHLAYIQFATAVINFFLNVFLIKKYGIMGAAVSTLLTFMFMAYLSYFVSQKLVFVRFEYSRLIKLVGITVLVYSVSRFIDLPLLPSVLLKVVLLLLFPVLLYIFSFFNSGEKDKGRLIFRHLGHKLGVPTSGG